MSTIAQNLAALQQAKADIAGAITEKGGTVQEGDGFSAFAADILTIPAGGGNLETKTVALDMSSGDQEVEPSSGYDGLSKVTVTRPATLIPENIKNGVSVGGISGTYSGTPIVQDLDGLVDGTIRTFTMPQGKTTIKARLFQNNSSLTYANLQGATQILDYAFSSCPNAEIILPSTLTNIGQYAFNYAGKSSALMELETISNCSVGDYAFQQAKISKVKGLFNSIGNYAFASAGYLQEVDIARSTSIGQFAFSDSGYIEKLHIVINGSIGNYAFNNCYRVSDLEITGTISGTLGSYAFYNFGSIRNNPNQNLFVLDFSSSTFTRIGNLAFGANGSAYSLRYMTIVLPSTCTQIDAQAFQYIQNSNIYFLNPTPATIQSNTFSNMSNTTLWVPYNSANEYRTKTNWTTVASSIQGWAPANTFTTGDTLPEINDEGYGLTWYSDEARTTQVTTVSDATQKYWCTVGTTVVAYRIKSVATMDCTVTISDGVKTYSLGDMVAIGASLTISTTGTDSGKPYAYMLNINDTDYAPATSETITVASDVTITAMYWDGENTPINPVFGDNSWDVIRIAVRNGLAANLWSVGDTKSVTLTNNTVMTVRIADLTVGRYTLADGTGSSNIVLEFVEQFANTSYMNSSNTNAGGWASSYMRSTTMASCLALLPQDMKDAISEVAVLSGTGSGTSSGTSSSANKLFLPCEWEIFGARSYSIGSSESPKGQFGYYVAHNTAEDRIKQRAGTAQTWWLRSPHSGGSEAFCRVGSGGGSYRENANNQYGVAPCFAI